MRVRIASTAPGSKRLPVGLLGQAKNTRRGCSRRRVSRKREASKAKSSPRGTSATRIPIARAPMAYIANVGTGIASDAPGPATTICKSWMASSEPFAIRICSAATPRSRANSPRSSRAVGSG